MRNAMGILLGWIVSLETVCLFYKFLTNDSPLQGITELASNARSSNLEQK